MWLEVLERCSGETDDGYFVFNPRLTVHAFCIGIRKAHYELLGAIGNCDTAWPASYVVFAYLIWSDWCTESDTIDKIVVSKRKVGFVLDGSDFGIRLRCVVTLVADAVDTMSIHLAYLDAEFFAQQALNKVNPGLVTDMIVVRGHDDRRCE